MGEFFSNIPIVFGAGAVLALVIVALVTIARGGKVTVEDDRWTMEGNSIKDTPEVPESNNLTSPSLIKEHDSQQKDPKPVDRDTPRDAPIDVPLIFRRHRPVTTERSIEGAHQEVLLMGMLLSRLLIRRNDLILTKAREGCRFKFLMLDPDCIAVDTEAKARTELGYVHEGNVERMRQAIRNCLNGFAEIEQEANQGGRSIVSMRLLKNFTPPFRLLITDRSSDEGLCRVEFYVHRRDIPDRPSLFLYRHHGYTYDFFCEQFDLLWEDATPWSSIDRGKEVNQG